jgi:PAS domain S-box-containing protein
VFEAPKLKQDGGNFGTKSEELATLVPAGTQKSSARKDAEVPMAQIEGTCHDLPAAAPEAVVVVNQAGEIVLLNVQAENQFGYRPDELLGQPAKNIIPEGFAERLHAPGLGFAVDALTQRTGPAIKLQGRRKDGGEIAIEVTLSQINSGQGSLLMAAIRDLSVHRDANAHVAHLNERHRLSEEALRECEERYRMLLDGIHDYSIFVMDPLGKILTWNAGAERIKGYRAEEIIGQNFSCFFTPEDIHRGKPEQILRTTAATGRHVEQSMRMRKDGTQFLARFT